MQHAVGIGTVVLRTHADPAVFDHLALAVEIVDAVPGAEKPFVQLAVSVITVGIIADDHKTGVGVLEPGALPFHVGDAVPDHGIAALYPSGACREAQKQHHDKQQRNDI